jgi:hypothetical protein
VRATARRDAAQSFGRRAVLFFEHAERNKAVDAGWFIAIDVKNKYTCRRPGAQADHRIRPSRPPYADLLALCTRVFKPAKREWLFVFWRAWKHRPSRSRIGERSKKWLAGLARFSDRAGDNCPPMEAFVFHPTSSSLVLPIGGLNRDCAHRSASAHLYRGREPKR